MSSPASRRVAPRPRVAAVVSAVRPGQWVKNLLIVVPALTSHRLFETATQARTLLAFIAFSLCASAGYVVNDLADREYDRLHATKRHRPFASGELSLGAGVALGIALLGGCIAIAVMLPVAFRVQLAVYAVSTVLYSVLLKRMVLLDVLMLAALYTLRIIAGTGAINVVLSPWLLAFSSFFFFSLALVKRTSELESLGADAPGSIAGRGYVVDDVSVLAGFGYASACTSVLVLALYVNAPEVQVLYQRPVFLWGLSPLFLYFLGRLWIASRRGKVAGDPLLYAARDPASYMVALVAMLILWLALQAR